MGNRDHCNSLYISCCSKEGCKTFHPERLICLWALRRIFTCQYNVCNPRALNGQWNSNDCFYVTPWWMLKVCHFTVTWLNKETQPWKAGEENGSTQPLVSNLELDWLFRNVKVRLGLFYQILGSGARAESQLQQEGQGHDTWVQIRGPK